ARLQMAAGAVGVCVQKTAEAEALAAGGVNNIYISNEVIAPAKLQRVVALAQQLAARKGQLAIAVDSLEGIRRLAAAAEGLPPGTAAVALVEVIAQRPQLTFSGLQAYHGRAQHLRTLAERRAAIAQVVNDVRRTVAALQAAGHAVPLVTGAGSGTFLLEAASGVYGELQAGSYLFMDRDYASNEPDPAQ